MTIQKFIEKHGIRFTCKPADANPYMEDMPPGSMHWRCTLRLGRRSMTVPFSQGPAICKEPTAADVLDCIASDVASVAGLQGFEEWCANLGYDPDSRKAEKTFRAIERQVDVLERWLGDSDAVSDLLFRTDRL